MAQPYLAIKRSAYSGWVPQNNSVHNDFVAGLRKSTARIHGHKDAVKQFDKDVTAEQQELFKNALTQVGIYYAQVLCPNCRHDHKLIYQL